LNSLSLILSHNLGVSFLHGFEIASNIIFIAMSYIVEVKERRKL